MSILTEKSETTASPSVNETCMRPLFRSYLFPFAFAILCAGTLLTTSDAFIDSRVLPKWYAFAFGITAVSAVATVVGNPDRGRFRKQTMQLCAAVVATCLVEVIVGTLQFVQLWPASGKFRVIGTFDNPAGFAAALCCGLPFVFPFLKAERRAARYSAIAAMTLIVFGIILSGSRAGMVCVAIVLAVRIDSTVGRRKLLLWGVLSAFLLLAGLYFLKRDSADGRLLIWCCSLEMVKDKPLFGHGPGGFAAGYMNYQADYFRTHPDSPYVRLADSVQHPFNEYLSVAVDYGLLGVAVLVALGWGVVRRYRRAAVGRDPAVRAAGTCLLAIGVFSLFSYPLFYPFTWVMALFSLWVIFGKPWPQRWLARGVAVGLAAGLCVWTVTDWRLQRAWYRVDSLATRGNPSASLSRYRELYPEFVWNRYFLYNFAYVLNEAGEYAEGLAVAEACGRLWADYYVELLRGEAALKLERYDEAERAFDQAAAMCPNRFMPLYKLVGIYTATGREAEARDLAERILAKEVKVPSATVTAIRYEMRRLVDAP